VSAVRVTGTTDPVEIATALTALFAARGSTAPAPTGYERWRERRLSALRSPRGRDVPTHTHRRSLVAAGRPTTD
jgi:hypothetical protein